MTESAGPGTDARRMRLDARFRRVVATLLRALGSTVVLVALYYLLPLDPSSIGVTVGMLAFGLVALVGLVAFQVRSIIRAKYPALRAVGALATSVPLFLLLFAGTYFVMGGISEANFSEPMTRTDALYFTVTVFATVGFGDIVATTQRRSCGGHGADGLWHRDHWVGGSDHCRRGEARAARQPATRGRCRA